MTRRRFLQATAATVTLGPAFWRAAYATPAVAGPGPYGPLQPADPATGLMLPAGFASRVVARTGSPIGPRGYVWHPDPDGGAVFGMPDGGWVYASNSERTPGGAGALRFDADGAVVDAYRILDGTRDNCAGGPTPWGTWLSCEEAPGGLVWECGVDGPGQGTARPALGAFEHEAVAVDPVGRRLYLTEDRPDGRLYRFTPPAYPDLSAGLLEAARVVRPVDDARTWLSPVLWVPVSPDSPASAQPAAALTTAFNGGEGIWHDAGHVYFTTKGDSRVWDLDTVSQTLSLLYDRALFAPGTVPLSGVDNVTVSPSGEVFVAEDLTNPTELVVIATVGGVRQVTPFARLTGAVGEFTGPAFTPDGGRLYFSSQRQGLTFEIVGPFNR